MILLSGFERRLVVIPFLHAVPKSKMDKMLHTAHCLTLAKPIEPGVYDVITDPSPDPEPQTGAFAAFILAHQRVILLTAAACAALALLAVIVVMALRVGFGRHNKGRH